MTRPPLAAALDLAIGVGSTFGWGWSKRVREWQKYGAAKWKQCVAGEMQYYIAAARQQSSAEPPEKVSLPQSEWDRTGWLIKERYGFIVFSAFLLGIGCATWDVVSNPVH